MTSPTTPSGIYSSVAREATSFARVRQLPLLVRRGGAFAAEVSLVAASALAPLGLGLYAKSQAVGQPVPLNPVLAKTEETIARVLALPAPEADHPVSPLTNLFWTAALILPVVTGGWQIYLLCKTGQTLPKRWLGVQVVSASGMPPTFKQVLLREGGSRWGLAVSLAYLVWRYTGAFPDLGILSGLVGLLLLGDGLMARSHPQRRTLHDRLSGTYVLDAAQTGATHPRTQVYARTPHVRPQIPSPQPQTPQQWDEDAAVAAIVLSSPAREPQMPARGLWAWIRQHPGATMLTLTLGGLSAVLGTFVGTQVYIQKQETVRDTQHQDNELFLSLVSKLTPSSPNVPDERRNAILALGSIDDPRAIPLLVALLGQETVPALIEATQQALVMNGAEALPELRDLNQALKNDLESMRDDTRSPDKELLALRLRATQRAIAKILTVHSETLPKTDLSRTDLGKTEANPFTLVLDYTDLSSLKLRGAILARASLKGSRFYGAGEDERRDTSDDRVAELGGADLREANLSEAILSRVGLDRANLMRANLTQANLTSASLVGANLSSARLVGADGQNATFDRASLTGSDLTEANLTGAYFRGAVAGQAIAPGSQFTGANLDRSTWQGSDLSAADFANADLQKADFSSTNLSDANFRGANLENTNFQNADLRFADLRGASLDGANFQGAKFVPDNSAEGDAFIERSPEAAKAKGLQGADFTRVRHLDPEDLAYLCQQGAVHPKCSR
ncbi:MAG TPA: pentapeptide repeat-containing protein [Oscillatoriales cyanobacterium M59_W2019_021]|nr:pentapeptide repeat-containing protein [Oscillatoriales cyanobacterium M4454_W2019_049]HIK52785.1 pentapeptide repeat-containing protein [Oscillatoriales cyanobacterium M59_W2019_021]